MEHAFEISLDDFGFSPEAEELVHRTLSRAQSIAEKHNLDPKDPTVLTLVINNLYLAETDLVRANELLAQRANQNLEEDLTTAGFKVCDECGGVKDDLEDHLDENDEEEGDLVIEG